MKIKLILFYNTILSSDKHKIFLLSLPFFSLKFKKWSLKDLSRKIARRSLVFSKKSMLKNLALSSVSSSLLPVIEEVSALKKDWCLRIRLAISLSRNFWEGLMNPKLRADMVSNVLLKNTKRKMNILRYNNWDTIPKYKGHS